MQKFNAISFRLSSDLDQRVEQLFSELIHKPWGSDAAARLWKPAFDVYETQSAYLIEADLPGVEPGNLDLRVEGRLLTISGRRDNVRVCHQAVCASVERTQGQFSRQFEFEHLIDPSGIESHFENGILRVHVPKKQPGRIDLPRS